MFDKCRYTQRHTHLLYAIRVHSMNAQYSLWFKLYMDLFSLWAEMNELSSSEWKQLHTQMIWPGIRWLHNHINTYTNTHWKNTFIYGKINSCDKLLINCHILSDNDAMRFDLIFRIVKFFVELDQIRVKMIHFRCINTFIVFSGNFVGKIAFESQTNTLSKLPNSKYLRESVRYLLYELQFFLK